MPRHLMFFVRDETWREHNEVGIAAINDPGQNDNSQAERGRQTAISEISGIRPGDLIFFKIGRGDGEPGRVVGLYRATSSAYYNPQPLFPGATAVSANLPFRVEFDCVTNYQNPVPIEHLWLSKERGKIWTMQQSRGDVLGRHACTSLSEEEAELIIKLLEANNPIIAPMPDYASNRAALGLGQIERIALPVSTAISSKVKSPTPGRLHYEAALQSYLLNHLANGDFKDVLGSYTDFMPYVSTGAQTEIDVLLTKRTAGAALWYEIVELKKDTFSKEELQKVIEYEKWIGNTKCDNALQVHSVGIGYSFSEDVKQFVSARSEYHERQVRLLEYRFDPNNNTIALTAIEPHDPLAEL